MFSTLADWSIRNVHSNRRSINKKNGMTKRVTVIGVGLTCSLTSSDV
jgi:hypothetical protein